MKSLPEFIKDKGSVEQAARALGISRQSIDRWIAGKSRPSMSMVMYVSSKGVDLLLLGARERPAPTPAE